MIVYHPEVLQGSEEWHALRCGVLGAGSMKLIMTPTLKCAKNDKERAHVYEIAAQRITKYVEPSYINDDMLRGHEDEMEARIIYSENIAPVEEVGYITNDRWGFLLGYSPDGVVGDDGLIECKSRRQKFQIETLVQNASEDTIPAEFMLQCQTGLLVTGRKWLDFISFSGGLHMAVIRVYPIEHVQTAILEAVAVFEESVKRVIDRYSDVLASKSARLFPTERRIVQEMFA